MKKTMIFKALMALIVIMLGANFNAEAQIGKNLLNKAKEKAKEAVQGSTNSSGKSSSSSQSASQPQQNSQQTQRQQSTQNQSQQLSPQEQRRIEKEKYLEESRALIPLVDENSSMHDRCRAFVYIKNNLERAMREKDLDFLINEYPYYDKCKNLVHQIDRDQLDDELLKGVSPSYLADDLTDIKFYFMSGGNVQKEMAANLTLTEGVPEPYDNIYGYMSGMLEKGESCKTDNAKFYYLNLILANREKYTVEFPHEYPTEENLCTERVKAFMTTISQDFLAQKKLPAIRPVEELRKARIENLEKSLNHIKIPASRDAALETKVKQTILERNPNAKIKLVCFASDATAEWFYIKNELDIPKYRWKEGYVVVEYPGKPGLNIECKLKPSQTYIGGGKYGASSNPIDNSFTPIDEKMIFLNAGWFGCDYK